MPQHAGPQATVNRTFGMPVHGGDGSSGTLRAHDRRDPPPGLAPHRVRAASIGFALAEKKKVKHFYGLMEPELRRLFSCARGRPGHPGEALLLLCERRLDNVLCRAGLARSRDRARHGILHGHILVNGRKVDRPSYLVRAGDVVMVRDRRHLQAIYRPQLHFPHPPARWLTVEPEALRATVAVLPGPGDISLPVAFDSLAKALSHT